MMTASAAGTGDEVAVRGSLAYAGSGSWEPIPPVSQFIPRGGVHSAAPRHLMPTGPVIRRAAMARHEVPQDPADQLGHGEALVEREMAEPATLAARDDHRELHRFPFPGALLFLGEHKCRLPR